MIVFENGGWQTDSEHPDDNWLEGRLDLKQPKFVIPDNSELAVKIQTVQNPKFITDDNGKLIDIVEGELTNEQQVQVLKRQLNELDLQAVRPLRAIAAGTATDEDKSRLSEIESQAETLRAEIANLGKAATE